MRAVIDTLVTEAIEPLFPTPAGMDRHSVRIYEDMVEVTNCPAPEPPPINE